MTELPNNWVLASLQHVATINPTLDKSCFPDKLEVSFVPMPSVEAETGKIDVSQTKTFAEVKKGYTPFRKDDVLFAKITPCMENGKMAVVPKLHNDVGFGSTEFHVLRAKQGIEPQYLYYYVSSKSYRYNAEHNMTGAVGQKRVPTAYLEKSFISLPPTNEQKRIVAKIEELFSELDKGIENLKTAREQLKVYRQAVLKHAFEGKLTANWREKNKDKLESTDEQSNSVKKSDKAFNSQEAADLPPIPPEWIYTRLANVGDLGRGKSKHRPRNDKKLFGGAYPFIQTGEVKSANRIVREYSQTYSDFGLAQSKLWPAGTLCITIAANIAETAFLGFDACFPDSVVGFSAGRGVILPEYVELFIQSVRARIEAYAPATAQKNINLTTLENLVIPLCSIDEQKEIVQQVDSIFTVIENNNEEIENNLEKAEVLRQSILKRAFSGKLVLQDPKDEPASILLERIKAEKNENPKRKKKVA